MQNHWQQAQKQSMVLGQRIQKLVYPQYKNGRDTDVLNKNTASLGARNGMDLADESHYQKLKSYKNVNLRSQQKSKGNFSTNLSSLNTGGGGLINHSGNASIFMDKDSKNFEKNRADLLFTSKMSEPLSIVFSQDQKDLIAKMQRKGDFQVTNSGELANIKDIAYKILRSTSIVPSGQINLVIKIIDSLVLTVRQQMDKDNGVGFSNQLDKPIVMASTTLAAPSPLKATA